MRFILRVFPIVHFIISLMFIGSALVLILLAVLQLWQGIQPTGGLSLNKRVNLILECLAILTVAVASLELGETILEEQVQREAQMSAPTRVRRFLSRFMVVLVVALSIEALVLVFKFSQEAPPQLPHVAAIGVMTAALLAAWGIFVWLNKSAEELEPQNIARTVQEDEKIE